METPWIALLDDDDTLRPVHCQALLELAEETGADLVWPQFDLRAGNRPPTNHPPDLHRATAAGVEDSVIRRGVGDFERERIRRSRSHQSSVDRLAALHRGDEAI